MEVLTQRRASRLKSLLQSVLHLPCSHVSGGGHSYPLPSTLDKDLSEPLPKSELRFLGRVFSLAGNVAIYPSIGCYGLRLGSSDPSLALHFFRSFGGHMYSSQGVGATQPQFRWQAHGEKAREIAALLRPHARRKERSLALLVEVGGALEKRERVEGLKRDFGAWNQKLKASFFEEGRVQTWEDFCELFDARGYVALCGGSRSLRLWLSHPNYGLLESIPTFLEREKVGKVSKAMHLKTFKGFKSYVWSTNNRVLITNILKKCGEIGLIAQRGRDVEALKIAEGEAFGRKGLLPVRSYHRLFQRLSAKECALSSLIVVCRQRLRTVRREEEVKELRMVLRLAESERKISRGKTEVSRIRGEVRRLLGEGGRRKERGGSGS